MDDVLSDSRTQTIFSRYDPTVERFQLCVFTEQFGSTRMYLIRRCTEGHFLTVQRRHLLVRRVATYATEVTWESPVLIFSGKVGGMTADPCLVDFSRGQSVAL